MALSNIRNEPRREITEQAIGFVTVTVWAVITYLIVKHLGPTNPGEWFAGFLLIGIVFPLILGICTVGLWYFMHEIGETLCGWMTVLGFDPRPKRRY